MLEGIVSCSKTRLELKLRHLGSILLALNPYADRKTKLRDGSDFPRSHNKFMVKHILVPTHLTHSPAIPLTGVTFPQLSTLTLQAHTDSEGRLLSLFFIFIFCNVLLPPPIPHLPFSKQNLGAFPPARALNGRGQERRLSCRQVGGICWRHFSAQ